MTIPLDNVCAIAARKQKILHLHEAQMKDFPLSVRFPEVQRLKLGKRHLLCIISPMSRIKRGATSLSWAFFSETFGERTLPE